MPGVIDYYFAPISGYAYLGHRALLALAAETGAEIRFHPLLIAKVFAATGTTPPFAQSEPRKSYRIEDQGRWAAHYGLPIKPVPAHWPTNPEPAARVILAAGAMGLDQAALSFACLRAVWAEDRDIAQLETLRSILSDLHMPSAQVLVEAESDAIDAKVQEVTEEAIAAEVFGSPTYVVGGKRFWGQDRLDFVRAAVLAEAA